MKIHNFLPACAIALTISACTGEDGDITPISDEQNLYEVPTVDVSDGHLVLSRTENEIATASEQLAYRTFERLAAQTPGTNILFSPASLWMALSLAANATDGATNTQLAEAMGISGIDLDAINDYNYKLKRALSEIDKNVDVVFANSIFSKTWMPLHAQFERRMKSAYEAEMFNFGISGIETAKMINSWAKQHTREKILNLTIAEEVRDIDFAFLNSVYFDAPWEDVVTTNPTGPLEFKNSNGSTSSTDLLHFFPQYFAYAVMDGVEFIEVPFSKGSFSLTIAMPEEKAVNFARPLSILKNKGISGIFDDDSSTLMRLELPAFRSDATALLIEALQSMGVTDIFSKEKADFSRMTSEPCFANILKQRTSFEINEKGANGASATILGGNLMSDGREKEIPVVRVDHPFMYIVTEKSSNSMIFIGSVGKL